jgi:hypothetical protein
LAADDLSFKLQSQITNSMDIILEISNQFCHFLYQE